MSPVSSAMAKVAVGEEAAAVGCTTCGAAGAVSVRVVGVAVAVAGGWRRLTRLQLRCWYQLVAVVCQRSARMIMRADPSLSWLLAWVTDAD